MTSRTSTRRFRSRAQRALAHRLAGLSSLLVALSVAQILAIRTLKNLFFIPGSSVGFYPTLTFIFFTIAPYTLLIGFVLPYSLFILRTEMPDYPGARVYIMDNPGDTAGAALFAFVLVHLVTPPLWAILIANLVLVLAAFPLFSGKTVLAFFGAIIVAGVLVAGVCLERATLTPAVGELVYYAESRYGRVAVHRDAGQYTLLSDGVPLFSSQNVIMAEEPVHYPLAQLDRVRHVLLISTEGGMMAEIEKYQPETVDYVELDPQVSEVLFEFGLIRKISGLQTIHRDGRAFLAGLMPGAFWGDRFSGHGIRVIAVADGLLILLMGALIPIIWYGGDQV